MNALKLPELANRGHSFKQRVAAAARATARIVPFVRSSAMATMTQTLSPEARDHQRPTRLERVGASAAKILHLPRRHRDSASDAPTTMFGGGEGGSAGADSELMALGEEFNDAVAEHERWEGEEYRPFMHGREHLSLSEVPGLSEMEDRRGELVDAYCGGRGPNR